MSHVFQIDPRKPGWQTVQGRAIDAIRQAHTGITVKIGEHVRSLDQNAKLWPMLRDFAQQVPWFVDGERQLIDAEDWKALLTAAFQQELRMAPSLRGGGAVMLGARTSKFTKRQMADFITFMYAEGNDRGVKWSEKSEEHIRRYGNQQREAA